MSISNTCLILENEYNKINNNMDIDLYKTHSLYNVPMRDVLLFRTHFIVKEIPINIIIKLINTILDNLNNFNYYFDKKCYVWNIKYSKGSITSNIQIYIYKYNQDDNIFIIESHRTSGEQIVFLNLYKKLKIIIEISNVYNFYSIDQILNKIKLGYQIIYNDQNLCCEKKFYYNIDIPAYSTYENFISGINPIFKMAIHSYNIESKLESSRMLCDLFSNSKNFNHLYNLNLNERFIEILVILLNNNMDQVKEYTVFAIKYFIKMECSKILGLIQWDIVKVLLNIINIDPEPNIYFQTIQLRIECSLILLEFIKKEEFLNKFINEINQNNFNLEEWKNNLLNIKDLKLKTYTDEIIYYLQVK